MFMDDFVFVNDDVVVFNKPAGMPSHRLKKDDVNTALDIVVIRYPEVAMASLDQREGGLVHRLDNNTSGLLIFARHTDSHALFRRLITENQIKKSYLALAQGNIANKLVLNLPIAHHPKNKSKMLVVKAETKFFRGQPRSATTTVEPIAWGQNATLVRVEIQGGRRHQIRIHLADAGYPLIGDELYGGIASTYLPGQALHADSIVLPEGLKLIAPASELFKSLAAKYGIGF